MEWMKIVFSGKQLLDKPMCEYVPGSGYHLIHSNTLRGYQGFKSDYQIDGTYFKIKKNNLKILLNLLD